jgi:hypothetical protein
MYMCLTSQDAQEMLVEKVNKGMNVHFYNLDCDCEWVFHCMLKGSTESRQGTRNKWVWIALYNLKPETLKGATMRS